VRSLCALLAAALLAVGAAQATAAPPKVPDPTYQSVSTEVLVPMDDGVKIATTVAIPSKDGTTPLPGPFPVVLEMTPYSRNGVCGCDAPTYWATRGIVGVVADVRGTGGSGGDLSGNYFSPREAKDGANLVEYFGTRPWSSGKVGMAGGSYLGITQYRTAEQQPPHLTAIAPQVAISDLYRDGFAHGGIENLNFDLQYIAVQGAPGTAGANDDPSLLAETLAAKAGQSPPGTVAFDYLARPNDDQFYRDRSPIYGVDKITVPVLDIGAWNDGLLRGETEMYTALAKRPGVETRLYMSPCTHKGCGAPFAPLTNPPNQSDLAAVRWEFLAKYLLGTPAPDRQKVQFFMQGRNQEVFADQWPPENTVYERLPLGTGEQQYVSNPAAGFSMAFDKYGTVAASPYIPLDQRLEGPQGITFRTPVLTTPLPIAGPIALHLVAASSATDTDWYAKLADVAPDGSESIITAGALRASHRALDPAKSTPARPYHTHTNPQPLEPGKFYDFDVEIWPTAYELAPGHQLQVRITSSDLPTHLPGTVIFDRDNPQNTHIDLLSPATNTVRMADSYLVLPTTGTAPAAATAPAPETAAVKPACTPAKPRQVRLRRGRTTTLRVTVTRGGHRVRGAVVVVRGPGFMRRAKTGRSGIARLRARAHRSGRTTVSTRACGAKLKVVTR
jgi:putative CocE/NonD family hydrolase